MDSRTLEQFWEFLRKDWIFFIKMTGEQFIPPFLNELAADLKDKSLLQPSNSPPSQMKTPADRKGSISTLEQILRKCKMTELHRFQKGSISLIRQGLIPGIMLQNTQVGADLEMPSQGANTFPKVINKKLPLLGSGNFLQSLRNQ